MDFNSSALVIALAIALAVSATFAAVIGRTAKSKGYSFGLFFFFGFISYLLTAVVAIFIRPKGQRDAKPKISSIALLSLGIIVEFTGLASLPALESQEAMTAELLANPEQFFGSLFIALAGILIVMGAVANDYRGGTKTEVRQL